MNELINKFKDLPDAVQLALLSMFIAAWILTGAFTLIFLLWNSYFIMAAIVAVIAITPIVGALVFLEHR